MDAQKEIIESKTLDKMNSACYLLHFLIGEICL